MRLREAVAIGLTEIGAHKVRSALSCLSISIGVAAMVYTFSQIEGMSRRFDRAVALSGPGRLTVERKQGYVSRGLSPGLTSRDAGEIRARWPELFMVYPVARRYGTRFVMGDFRNSDIRIDATTEEWRKRDWVYSLRGRFFNSRDVAESARVCVLIQPGGWVRTPPWARYFTDSVLGKALAHHDALGRTIRIEDHLFTVIGILREPPMDRDPRWIHSGWGGSGVALVPITTYHHFLGRSRYGQPQDTVDEIQVDTGDGSNAGLYRRRIEALLKSLHRGEDDVTIRDFREIIQGVLNRIRQYAMAILAIGIVAILAGGIGIMNVTLATVFSRIREIGIRRALGATRGDILGQFLTEATLLGGVGGLAGVGLGAAAVTYLSPRADRMAEISFWHVLAALAIAAAAAFLFALYPAYQASRLDPIEALRYE